MFEGNLMVDCPFCNDETRGSCEFCMGSGEIAHDDIPLGDPGDIVSDDLEDICQ